jgi:hypothetical protein
LLGAAAVSQGNANAEYSFDAGIRIFLRRALRLWNAGGRSLKILATICSPTCVQKWKAKEYAWDVKLNIAFGDRSEEILSKRKSNLRMLGYYLAAANH